jgi:hypothetical protein
VIGGCEDDEFAKYSIRLLGSFVREEPIHVMSSLPVQELTTPREELPDA